MKRRFHLAAAIVALMLAAGLMPAGGQGLGALFGAGGADSAAKTENASTARAEVGKRKRYKSRRKFRREARKHRAMPRQDIDQPAAETPEAGIWPPLTVFELRWEPANSLPPAGDVRTILKW